MESKPDGRISFLEGFEVLVFLSDFNYWLRAAN